MSRHDDTITLRQMLNHIEEAVALAKDRTSASAGGASYRCFNPGRTVLGVTDFH
jgi:hypothetical protein